MSSKPVVFKINGKEAFDPRAMFAPGLPRVLKVIDDTEVGSILYAEHIADRLGILADTVSRKYGQELEKRGYAMRVGQKRYYGKPDTIKALKNELDG